MVMELIEVFSTNMGQALTVKQAVAYEVAPIMIGLDDVIMQASAP